MDKKKKRRHRCDCCRELKDDVIKTIDPYQQDVDNIEIETWLCDQCYQAACDDI